MCGGLAVAETAIALNNLDFSYGELQVLKDVNLCIEANDSICIVGPNGGGKTTLVKLILGLLQPDTGTIRVHGQSPADARLRIGYVPQVARYDSLFPVSVLDVVLMGRLGCSPKSRFSAADREKAMAAMAEMDIVPLAANQFADISGGQQQRVLIARALATEGDILILDEPTANIDQKSEKHLFKVLGRLNERMTILMVTHEVAFAVEFFERIVCVNRQVLIHPTSELTGELIRDMYGGDIKMIRHDHHCSAEGHSHG